MEYIGNCPCGHHTIVNSVKQIHKTTKRKPQREAKCLHCGQTKRITILGEVYPDVSGNPNAEFATHDKLIIKLW